MSTRRAGRNPEGLLLDLDRTLVDVQTFTDYEAAVAEVTGELGEVELVEVPKTEWRSATAAAMAILVALAGDPVRWQRASDLIEAHEIAAVGSATAMDGLNEFLRATAALPRAIVTLMGPKAMALVCRRFGIEVPIQVGRAVDLAPKPAPDQILQACHQLDVPPTNTVMIGDSTWDLDAAAAAGARFVGLTNRRPSEFPPGTTIVPTLGDAMRHFAFPM